jgi:ABC-type branched-subunit amino acid transport system ATPase component/branched-subunit amino acid ABC-type transport system permease component
MLPFIVIGLTSGAVYALAGLGLVLTYKSSGVFNFAHGALATVSAFVFYSLFVTSNWPWPLAAAVSVLLAGPLMGLLLELLARRIQTAPLALQVASTVGLLLVIETAVALLYGATQVRTVPTFLGPGSFTLFGTVVQVSQVVTFLFAIVLTALLTGFFRYSRWGVSMRAVVDNPELLDMAGTSPVATRRVAWMIGATLAAASGVLFAPILSLDPVQLTLLVVAAYGGAAIGAFRSLPLTLAGGLFIGVTAALCTKWFTTGLLSGLSPSLPFVVLFAVLLFFPRRYLAFTPFTAPRSRPNWAAPASLQLTGAIVLIVLLALVPGFAGIHLTAWTTFVAMSIAFMSLSLLVQTSGQVSLGHVAFIAIGAAAFAHLTASHVPWFIALTGAGLIAVPIGALLAIPAIRLGGLYLALATFGFGILLQEMFYPQGYMFGTNGIGLTEPMPSIASSGNAYYLLVLIFAVACAVFVLWLTRSRLGRLLRGAADSSVALQTVGTSVNVTRVMVFCISAFMAAIGGALAAVGQFTISADSYQPITSLEYFVVIIVVGRAMPWNAMIAAAALFLLPSYLSSSQTLATWIQLLAGLGAIGYAIAPAAAHGVPLPLQSALDATFGRIRLPIPSFSRKTAGSGQPAVSRMDGGLEVRGAEVRFGGLVAVDGLTLAAGGGNVTGLIGPNGAGKTTTFNVCTGLIKPSKGHVLVAGADVSHLGPAARARRGVGRTFQKMELFESLTVRENVEAGAEGSLAGGNPVTQFLAKPGHRQHVRASAKQAMELCGISHLASRPAASLSTGQRRLVELARCLAGPFGMLLLDEPSSGLDQAETQEFAQILKKAVAERGVGILLVEHDMSLVLGICQHVYVLDFGKLIFEGTAQEVVASPAVRTAYLGDTEVETAAYPSHEVEEPA